MSQSIENLEHFSKMLKVSENLYVQVYIEVPTVKAENQDFWDRATQRLMTACQEAIKAIYTVTGAFPIAEQRVAKDTDPCIIKFVDYHVFGNDVLAWFECEQMPNRS
jgi:hypothetical protein